MTLSLLLLACLGGETQCVVFEDSCDCDAAPACMTSDEAEAAGSCDKECLPDTRPAEARTCAVDDDGACAFQ